MRRVPPRLELTNPRVNARITSVSRARRRTMPRARKDTTDDAATAASAVDDGGAGESSLSVDATNALRRTLGLAPLKESSTTTVDADAKRAEDEAKASSDALRAKIAAAKERREMERVNAATTKLGDGGDKEEDDVNAWLAKSKTTMVDKTLEAEREKAKKVAAMFAARDADAEEFSESDEDGDDAAGTKKRGKAAAYTSKDLKGLKVRHNADDIVEGREVVLTLKDTSVLDDDGEDELENVLLAEQKARKKARREATKKSDDPFGEDDTAAKKTVLGKYDEKAEDEAMELDGEGLIDAQETKRKEDIKARLAAELSGLKGTKETAEIVKGEQMDYHTQEEMQAKFVKREKKKKMRKKLRKKHIDAAELEQDELAPATNDLGSRRSRAENGSAVEKDAASKLQDKNAKFASALQKARDVTDKKILAELAGDVEEEEDEDDELSRALARSRRMAQKNTSRAAPVDVAAQVAARRLADEASAKERAGTVEDAVVFTDMQEFVQGITADDDDGDGYDEDAMPDVPPPPPPPPSAPMDDDAMDEDMPDIPPPPPPPGAEDDDAAAAANVVPTLTERHMPKKGLAGTLALLKEKAQLDDAQNTRWSGRANDMKDRFDKAHVLEAHAVNDESVDGYKFGFKLDKFDEFGRKLTPKEAFRELCHRFHGIEPGKMKREKRLRQFQEEQARLKASSSMDAKVKDVQREQATPYVVLSGNISAGQTKQANPLATMKREQADAKAAATPQPTGLRGTKSKATTVAVGGKVEFAMKSAAGKKPA